MTYMMFDDGPIGGGTEAGTFASVGSAMGGIRGRIAFGNGFSIQLGLAYGAETYANATLSGAPFGALSLRYVMDMGGGFHPYVEAGGWMTPTANMKFSRSYINGGGVATVSGKTNGVLSYYFGRLGIAYQVDPSDQIALSTELGQSALSIDAYSEALSAANPFPAAVSSGTTSLTVAKIRGQWTHNFTDKIDATAYAGVSFGFNGRTSIVGAVTGVGTFAPVTVGNATWGELGLRLGYKITPNIKINAFANGEVGDSHIGNAVHVGLGLDAKF